MRSTVCFVFAILMVSVHAKKGTRADFEGSMTLQAAHLQDIFDGMDVKDNDKIDMDDLNMHYYHKDVAYAKDKFIKLISKDGSNDVCKDELDKFVKQQPVTNAIWECTYLISESMREACFADQLTYYVSLLLDSAAVDKFFKTIEDPADKDNVITIEDVKKMASLNTKFTDKEMENFIKELGGSDGKITFDEFEDYVSEEDLLDDFRECRKKIVGCNAEYDDECLKKELIDHTIDEVTRLDMFELFDEFEDDADNDFDITIEDLKKHSECNDDIAKRFIQLMDQTGDNKVTFGEHISNLATATEKLEIVERTLEYKKFRTYVRNPLVHLHLERDCAAKLEEAQELSCFKKELLKRVAENHTPIWLNNGDMSMLILFEELDDNDNGKITESELINAHGWSKETADKMVKEMDGKDADEDVDLSEFLAYTDLPNIIYGVTDCASFGRNEKFTDCHSSELKANIEKMLDKPKVMDFFKFYDKDGNFHITRKEVEAAGVTGEDLQNFVDEMGMGDDTITVDEFKWYVRQQELSEMFLEAACSSPAQWHKTVLDFMEERVTQYDVQELFDALDTDDNWELSVKDVGGDNPDMKALHQRMDGQDKGETVDFFEFWVYLHTPIGNPRKKHLEEKCTKPNEEQAKEMECYKTEIVNVGK